MAASSLLAEPPATPPATLLKRHAVDVSNYTSYISLLNLMVWREQLDIGLVLVQSLDSARFPQTRTTQQLIGCHAAGIACDVYVYPFFANGISDCARRLNEAAQAGVPIRRVWLDVEDVDPSQAAWTPSQRIEMLKRWFDTCDQFPAAHRPAGYYGGAWYHVPYLADTVEFSDRPLWAAQYDGIDDTNVFTPFGGWSTLAIKQYRGTSVLGGITGVDLDVLSDQERALA